MLPRRESYDALCRDFRWRIPERFNMGVAVCDAPAARIPDRPAIIAPQENGKLETVTFARLKQASNRLANVFCAYGLSRGDRVAILLPQCPETAIAHIAAYKAGMIAIPLSCLFRSDALSHRLHNAGARALITDSAGLAVLCQIRDDLPALETVFSIDGGGDGADSYHAAVDRTSDIFAPIDTAADDPAFISFTSGTTGPPKGALQPHRTLLGHLPGIEFPHELFPEHDDLFWTPADWAWMGGLMDVLMPSLYHGVPVLAYRAAKFDPAEAFDLIARYRVRNAFIPPTALKMMRQVPDPHRHWDTAMRTIGSGGEALGSELLDWGRDTFGLTINEFYGQTECNLVIGNCAAVMPVVPGSMGRAIPGHDVAIVQDDGTPVPDGGMGHIAVRRGDPVAFLGYWNDPAATYAKFAGDWFLTGDIGVRDDAGYFHYTGRDDDVITSAGYRIGPGEIEDCLMKHPAVALAAVVGVPDPMRTESIKACIVLRDGMRGTDTLQQEIRDFVRGRLAAHEYPRLIEFHDSLPLTTTGKIMRRKLRDAHPATGAPPP
ncbi:MAG: acyl-CoA synthetase [Alphaproteobacteria bacterium]|nr:acyl-CoA synthetase [Alphaproteobacteria bacterium]